VSPGHGKARKRRGLPAANKQGYLVDDKLLVVLAGKDPDSLAIVGSVNGRLDGRVDGFTTL
jgi:hypothetical protein